MKPLLLFLALSAVLFTVADEKYLLTRQPTPSTQVGEMVTVPPGGTFIADETGKISGRVLLPTDISGVWGKGTVVSNFSQLQSALGNANTRRIMLASDINVTANIEVQGSVVISFNGYKLKEQTASTILYMGGVDAGRYQIFENWEAGDIKGSFLSGVVYPEWWGLQDGFHDRAINAAAGAFVSGVFGVEVSLGTGTYTTSAPIELSGSLSVLRGQGDGRTRINSASTWGANTFIECTLWDHPGGTPTGFKNHSAMVWIGNGDPGTQTMRTAVEGVSFNCYNAAVAHPTKRISGISSKGWVEENSFIRHVVVVYYTGVGIGFPVHPENTVSALINGLSIRDFWVDQGMRRDSYPMYFTHNCVRASLSDFTIYSALARENSAGAVIPPAFVMDWPKYGIFAAGKHLDIRNGHIEGVQAGIYIGADAPSNITIDNVDVNHMMRGDMVYYTEDAPGYTSAVKPPPSLAAQIVAHPANATRTRPFLDYYSTVVLISAGPIVNPIDGINQGDSCNLRNITAIGQCDYLVRDCVYGVHVSAFGQGQNPATGTGCVKQYIRNNAYPLPTNNGATDPPTWVAGTPYYGVPLESPPALPVDKTYFSLIQ